MKSPYRTVESFDGQTITVDGKPCYELGGFLGGGAAGVVYEVRFGLLFFFSVFFLFLLHYCCCTVEALELYYCTKIYLLSRIIPVEQRDINYHINIYIFSSIVRVQSILHTTDKTL